MPLTPSQINSLVIIERSTATVSVLSTLLLLTTYCLLKQFRTLSNTLIFYASFANLFANVACLLGRDAIHNPGGALCQFQAFLLEMFMQADPLWSCAMSINVYLCIFRRWDTVQLRKMHWKYILFCYGLPFIPAIFCLFYQDHRGMMYGDATLWCWINSKYADVRIWSYYLPIWISILISLVIYFRVGFVIYRVRADIRALENSGDHTLNDTISSDDFVHRPSATSTILEDIKTSTTPDNNKPDAQITFPSNVLTKSDSSAERSTLEEDGISRWDSADFTVFPPPPPSTSQFTSKLDSQDEESQISSLPHIVTKPPTHPPSSLHRSPTCTSPLDPTWTHPSLLNSRPSITSLSPNAPQEKPKPRKMSKLQWNYTKSALLFTISILITWVPASINRAQNLTHPGNPSFALNVMSAFVLPLQGFWNTVIFFVTSWGVVRRERRRWRRWRRGRKREALLTREREKEEMRKASEGSGESVK